MKKRVSWLAAGTVVVCAASGVTLGDVVLHPGTINGKAGLVGASFSSGTVSVGNGSFTANTGIASDGTFSLTTEGDQVYSSLSWSMYGYSPNYQQVGLSTGNAGISVPAGGSVQVDVSRAGGTLHLHIDVNKDPTTLQPLGSIASATFNASAYANNESYGGYAQGAADTSLAMFAGNVSISGQATVNVLDETGLNVKCTTTVSLDAQSVTLGAGETKDVSYAVTIDPSVCAQAVVTGKIGLHDAPAGTVPSSAYVYVYGASYLAQQVSGFSATALDLPFTFEGLQKAYYYIAAYMYFPPPYAGDYLSLPNQNQSQINLTAGGAAERDFVFEGAVATGAVKLSGTPASDFNYGYQYFYGSYDYTQPNYGPSAGGYASGPINTSTGAYNVMLTPGTWQQNSTYLGFAKSVGGIYLANYVNVSQPISVDVAAGETKALADQPLSLAEGSIVFDVVEPDGSPTIGISNPYVYVTSRQAPWVSEQGYAYVSNAATPSVRVIGPPGDYQFDAYATVNGTQTKFATSTITLGAAVNTPVGNDVHIVATDANGNPTPVTLDFGTITKSGDTSVSFTSVGPGAPKDYSFVDVTPDDAYTTILTNATFTNVKVCTHYISTGLTDAQEQKLELWQFVNDTWQKLDSITVDTSNDLICGVTSQLGTFGVLSPNVVEVPPTDSCVGAQDAPAVRETDANVCTVTVDNTNQLAGGCGGGGGGLASCAFDGQTSEALSLGEHTVAVFGTAGDGSTASCSSYVTVVDRQPPVVTCPAPATVECTGATTPVSPAATCTDNCDATTCTTSCGHGDFALGTTPIKCNAQDAAGNTAECDTTVKIVDTRAPDLSVAVSPTVLAVPNHKLVGINITRTTTDVCDGKPVVTCTAKSSEPDNGLGDGDTANDVQWVNGNLLLRSERSGTGTGRIYTITCTATDASGNATTRTAVVTVPLSR